MPARQLRLLRPAIILLGLGLLASAGCSSGGGTTVVVTHPTMIEIAPERFLGDVPCSEGPGLKRYVATLIDTDYFAQGGAGNVDPSGVEAGGAPMEFQLPSSGPTPCLAAVGFGLVVPGRHYDVKIDGYDTDDLAPRATGSRQMVSPAPTDENPVSPLLTPRWTAHCEDAMAVESTIVQAVHCTPFKPVDAAAPGEVRVNLSALMGGLACGEEPGQVDRPAVPRQVARTHEAPQEPAVLGEGAPAFHPGADPPPAGHVRRRGGGGEVVVRARQLRVPRRRGALLFLLLPADAAALGVRVLPEVDGRARVQIHRCP